MAEIESILKHLHQDYTEPLRDPLWSNILLSPELLKLVALPSFQGLNQIKQLGPTYLVYPGATHTRLNHSLGVFHIAQRMISHLLKKNGFADFTLQGVKAFLCAALLHDLGHYPFAHSFKDLDVESHESLTARRIFEEDYARILRDEVGVDPALVAAIIDPALPAAASADVGLYRNLLSGVLDPDKLDYLNRDAYFCGVPYGIQDVDFVLDEISFHPGHGLGISRKGLPAVESILFSKYLMYRSVYWHKTVRIATAMIKKAVLMGLASGAVESRSLYWMDDADFYALADAADYPPLALIRDVQQRQLYKSVASLPFDRENRLHRSWQDLRARLAFEEALAREVSRRTGKAVPPETIIVDIPEPISFEIDLPVIDPRAEGSVSFAESKSVFAPEVVSGFAVTLRQISLIAARDEEVLAALERMGPARLLERGA
jgi:HD superfamily phosphohydrolase